LTLVEDPTESEIAAKQRCEDGESEGFDEPDGADDFE
jgi:hypothetical protein